MDPYPGLSWGFILIFFGPLLLGVVGCFTVAVRKRAAVTLGYGMLLSILWLPATAVACFYISFGYAFNHHPDDPTPTVTTIFWLIAGFMVIWLPLLAAVGVRRVS